VNDLEQYRNSIPAFGNAKATADSQFNYAKWATRPRKNSEFGDDLKPLAKVDGCFVYATYQ
jgi:hypothetical protein